MYSKRFGRVRAGSVLISSPNGSNPAGYMVARSEGNTVAAIPRTVPFTKSSVSK